MFIPTTALTPVELRGAIVRDPLVVSPDTTVINAIAQMSGVRSLCHTTKTADGQLDDLHLEVRSSCVLVVENGQVGGVLTERDVVRLSAQQQPLDRLVMRQVMAQPVVTLRESAFIDLFFAINLLQQHHIRHLPILDDRDRLVGLLTHESLRQSSRPIDLLRLRLVVEVMTREVVSAAPDCSMLEIAQLMAEHRISSVTIVEPGSSPTESLQIPVGIVTERDLVQFQALGLNLERYTAQAVMSTPIFTVNPEDSLLTVQQMMDRRSIRRLAVTGKQGQLLGIVTQTSLLQALNPLELYNLAEALQAHVVKLEEEKVSLLQNRNIELERQVDTRTVTLKTKAQREKLVAELATQIRSSLSLQTILDTTVEQIRQVLECDRVNIWQFEADWQILCVAESTNSSMSMVGERVNDTYFKQDRSQIYCQGYVHIVSDIYKTEISNCHRDLLIRLQTRAKILVPILCDDRLWGLLNVTESQHPRDWQPEEVELLQVLSIQLGIALQQATSHQKLQEELAERQRAESALQALHIEIQERIAEVERTNEQLQQTLEELATSEEELKQRNLQLERERLRYQDLFNFAPDGYLVTDTAGKVREANQRIFEQLSVDQEFLIGQPFTIFVAGPDRKLCYTQLQNLLTQRQIQTWEITLTPRNGDDFPAEVTVAPIDGSADTVTGLRWLIRDISDRKQAEKQLQQLNQALEAKVKERTQQLSRVNSLQRAILNGADYSIISCTPTGIIQTFNASAERLLGYSASEMVGKATPEVIHDASEVIDRAASLSAELGQVVTPGFEVFVAKARQGIVSEEEWTYIRKDGSRFPVWLSITALKDTHQKIIGFLGIAKDITDRKQAELERQKLIQELSAFKLALDRSAIVAITDAKGVITYVNDLFCTISGYCRDQLIGQTHRLVKSDYHPPTFFQDLWHTIASGQIWRGEICNRTKDGRLYWVTSTIVPFLDKQGQPFQYLAIRFDITDRKQAELDLQESQRFIQQIADASPNILYLFDLYKQQNIYVNREISTVLGYTPAEIQAMGSAFFPNLMHPDDLGRVAGHIERINMARDGEILEFEYRMRHRNGEWRWLYSRDVVFSRDAGGRVKQTIGTAEDITDRKLAEAEISQQLHRQQTLGAIAQQIRESLDIKQILTTVTQQVKEILQADRVIAFRLFADGRGQIVEEAVSSEFPALQNGQWKNEVEVWSQEILDYYWQGNPRIVPDVMTDIWANCLVEYSIQSQIQSKIVAPILQEVRSRENHRWITPGETNKLWGVLVVHACQEKRVWQESEAQLLQQIANQLAIAIQQASLFEQLQEELIERQQAEVKLTESNQQLAISNEELARATRLKDEFLANMSHELRTPLNAILGMSEGLQEQVFGILNTQQLKALRTIESSGTHLLELINDILDVAKIESGQIELNYTPTAVAPLCQSSLIFIKQQALKKNIQLEIKLPPNLPDLLVDERRIRQVLINLLNNAVKFTPEGGRITLEVSRQRHATVVDAPPLQGITRVRIYRTVLEQELGIRPQAEGVEVKDYLRIAIIDTGIGIAPENMDKLFQPFIQIDSALNRQYQGTGLGLALVKRIVELHGGEVGLSSNIGIGSCFTIDLPYAAGGTSSPKRQVSQPEVRIEPSPGDSGIEAYLPAPEVSPQILLAEDNEANISTISSYLKAKGYRLVLAKNGAEAIALAESEHPDLILMDIQMPGMDGLEAIQQIRLNPNLVDVPIIALTALAMTGDRDRCLAAGANDYLSKPVKLKQLVTTIEQLLSSLENHP